MRKRTRVVGVWDDHDYGLNDGDRTFAKRDLVRDVYLDFLDEPEDSERRLEKGTGIFQDYEVRLNGVKVHLILIDVRYDFDKPARDRFGQYQLAWLESTIARHLDSDVTLIGLGVQGIVDRNFVTEALNW